METNIGEYIGATKGIHSPHSLLSTRQIRDHGRVYGFGF